MAFGAAGATSPSGRRLAQAHLAGVRDGLWAFSAGSATTAAEEQFEFDLRVVGASRIPIAVSGDDARNMPLGQLLLEETGLKPPYRISLGDQDLDAVLSLVANGVARDAVVTLQQTLLDAAVRLRVCSWNVHYWCEQNELGQQPQPREIIDAVKGRRCDVCCLQEVISGAGYHLYRWGGYPGEIGTRISTRQHFPGSFEDHDVNFARAADLYIMGSGSDEKGFGNAVLVREEAGFEVEDRRNLSLVEGVDFSGANGDSQEGRSAAISCFRKGGVPFAVASAHLDVFDRRKLHLRRVRDQQLWILHLAMTEYLEAGHVCVIAMDANMATGMVQHLVDSHGWVPAVSRGIDHILFKAPPGLRCTVERATVANLPTEQGVYPLSDHPLLEATLRVQRAGAGEEEPPLYSLSPGWPLNKLLASAPTGGEQPILVADTAHAPGPAALWRWDRERRVFRNMARPSVHLSSDATDGEVEGQRPLVLRPRADSDDVWDVDKYDPDHGIILWTRIPGATNQEFIARSRDD